MIDFLFTFELKGRLPFCIHWSLDIAWIVFDSERIYIGTTTTSGTSGVVLGLLLGFFAGLPEFSQISSRNWERYSRNHGQHHNKCVCNWGLGSLYSLTGPQTHLSGAGAYTDTVGFINCIVFFSQRAVSNWICGGVGSPYADSLAQEHFNFQCTTDCGCLGLRRIDNDLHHTVNFAWCVCFWGLGSHNILTGLQTRHSSAGLDTLTACSADSFAIISQTDLPERNFCGVGSPCFDPLAPDTFDFLRSPARECTDFWRFGSTLTHCRQQDGSVCFWGLGSLYILTGLQTHRTDTGLDTLTDCSTNSYTIPIQSNFSDSICGGVGSPIFDSLAQNILGLTRQTHNGYFGLWGFGSLHSLPGLPKYPCAAQVYLFHFQHSPLFQFNLASLRTTDCLASALVILDIKLLSFTAVGNKASLIFFRHIGVGSHFFDSLARDFQADYQHTALWGLGSLHILTGPAEQLLCLACVAVTFADATFRAHCTQTRFATESLPQLAQFDLFLHPHFQAIDHFYTFLRLWFLLVTCVVQSLWVLCCTSLLWVTAICSPIWKLTFWPISSIPYRQGLSHAGNVFAFFSGQPPSPAELKIDQDHSRGSQNWLSALQIFSISFWCKPGPNSRNKLTLKRRHKISHCLLLLLITGFFLVELVRSEGCISAMGDAEASPPGKHARSHTCDAKQHGTRPETPGHRLEWHPAQRQIVKRSIRRAYARSLAQGVAWYRGRCYSPTDFPKHLQTNFKPPIKVTTPTTESIIRCNQKHQDARRFKVLNWNAGGLSAHKLDTIKVWMIHQQIEAAFITETRWTFESTWMDDHFHFVHTGDPEQRGAGILGIIARSFCSANHLRWRVVQPGRLLHLQAQMEKRCIDLVGCYQHTAAATRSRQLERTHYWDTLEQFLHGLVMRNILILAGDFNCDLLQAASHSGPSHFTWRKTQTPGATHSDNGRFTSILRGHGLTALNTWQRCLGPTYIHADACSRIDFIITRKHVADGISKTVTYAWEAPFAGDSGHVPMIAQIRKQWYNPKGAIAWGLLPAQRAQGNLAYRLQTPQWQAFTERVTARLTDSLADVTTSDEDFIPNLHQVAIQCFQDHFPIDKTQNKTFDETTTSIVMSKWQHRRAFLTLTMPTAQNVFKAWRHWAKFAMLNRQSKQHAKQVRRNRFAEVIQQAQQAAHRHDSHMLFSLINKFAPKQSRRKMQLRNAQGHLASPIEETALLKRFIMDTWAGPATFPTVVPACSGMPFTLSDLTTELSRIPALKAVARPCAPGTVWRTVAASIAPLIYAKLAAWWQKPEPFLPRFFRDAWMILIPKPNKPPVHPRALRPLALQDPISKAIVGLLTRIAQKEAYPMLTMLPLWAYLPGRSTQDALMRVSQHCRDAHALLTRLRSTPFTRHSGIHKLQVAGGLQLFLDIERAFDMVSRESLFTKLGELGINPQIVSLLSLWHQNTQYHLESNGEDHPISVGRGVRQGCRAAPLLWNGYMWLFLIELSRAVGWNWVIRCLNIYADDCQMGDLFTNKAELDLLMHNIAITIELLKTFGLSINPAKCTVLLTMGGTNFRKLRASLTAWRDGKEWICFHGATEQTFWIPLDTNAKYLGTIISYRSMENKTTTHRIQLARIAFSRLRRWLTGARGLSTKQRIQLFTTCVYPILSYGIFAIGLTPVGLQNIQKHMYGMLRQVLNNHAYVTGHCHQDALAQNRVAPPIAWLLDSVDSLRRSLQTRVANALPTDMIHHMTWDNLDQLRHTLHEHLTSGPPILVQPATSEVPTALYSCQQCDFCTTDVAHFRRHCTMQHDKRMNRSMVFNPQKYMLHGLPQCRFCLHKYTTWRAFCIHVQRGCQVLVAGPPGCWSRPERPLALDPAWIPDMFTDALDNPIRGSHPLTDADLSNLLSQDEKLAPHGEGD